MVPKIHQNGTQNPPKLVQKSSLGGVLGVSCCKLFFVPFFPPFFPPLGGILERTWAPSWSQVAPSWEQVGPSWGQDAPCWRQVGPSWCQRCPSWRQNGPNMGFQGRSQRMFKFVSIFNRFCIKFDAFASNRNFRWSWPRTGKPCCCHPACRRRFFSVKMTTPGFDKPLVANQLAADACFFSENDHPWILQALLLLTSLPQALFSTKWLSRI